MLFFIVLKHPPLLLKHIEEGGADWGKKYYFATFLNSLVGFGWSTNTFLDTNATLKGDACSNAQFQLCIRAATVETHLSRFRVAATITSWGINVCAQLLHLCFCLSISICFYVFFFFFVYLHSCICLQFACTCLCIGYIVKDICDCVLSIFPPPQYFRYQSCLYIAANLNLY